MNTKMQRAVWEFCDHVGVYLSSMVALPKYLPEIEDTERYSHGELGKVESGLRELVVYEEAEQVIEEAIALAKQGEHEKADELTHKFDLKLSNLSGRMEALKRLYQ